MKKLTLFCLFYIISICLYAQKLDAIKEMYANQQFFDAKDNINKFLANPKKLNDPEAWYVKGQVYHSISLDTANGYTQMFLLKDTAYTSFKKNQELDSKDILMTLELHRPYLDLYYEYYDLGAKAYNQSDFVLAVNSFEKAIEIKDFILKNKYKYDQTNLYEIDTPLILNIAVSNIKANKLEEAAKTYEKLISANVAGENYKEVYLYLLDYYSKIKNQSALQSILTKSKNIYPEDLTWVDFELKEISKTGDLSKTFSKYDEILMEYPNNFLLHYNYAVEIYNALYGKNASKVGDTVLFEKLSGTLKRAIVLEDKKENSAMILITHHLFNAATEIQNKIIAIKGNKPEDLKKKNKLKSTENVILDDCIKYCENAISFLEKISKKSNIQKANYKIVIGYLIDIYNEKNNSFKAAEYQKLSDSAEKL
jgi:hypothetical protein